MNVFLLKLISVAFSMLKIIAIFIMLLPVVIMSAGLAFILKGDPRTADGYKRKPKN